MKIEEVKRIINIGLGKEKNLFTTSDSILKASKILLNELDKKDTIIKEIQEEVREHIGFENRLKKDKTEPDLFNQGRFYVANNIKDILKKAEEK